MISTPLIAARAVPAALDEAVVLDVRAGAGAADAYAASHVAGAIYVDLDDDLSELGDPASGGRHPLPPLRRWLDCLGAWGITPTTPVIVYDASGGGMAGARAWWMLRAVGHALVSVVDGGWPALVAAGVATSSSAARVEPVGRYPGVVTKWPTVDAGFVDRVRNDPNWLVIDARAPERYRGETEPLDPVAGHIPGAHNLYWQSQLDADSRFLSRSELKARYAELCRDVPSERIVCYCGSGVTACHLLLAIEACGLQGAQLYVGSWSEWCRQDRPRAPGA